MLLWNTCGEQDAHCCQCFGTCTQPVTQGFARRIRTMSTTRWWKAHHMDECIQISEQTSQDVTDIVGSGMCYTSYGQMSGVTKCTNWRCQDSRTIVSTFYRVKSPSELHLSICWRLWPIKPNAVTGHQSARRTTPLQ